MADEGDDQFEDDNQDDVETYSSDKKKHPFAKEIKSMMYGFGDDENPYQESVEVLEDLVIHFIQNMTCKCMDLNKQNRVQIEDLMFILRKDPRKYARAKDLLIMNEELKRARKAFDDEAAKY